MGLWPVRNWATQKDVSSEPVSEALSAAAHCYLLFSLPPEPLLILQPAPSLPWLTLLPKPCSLHYAPRSMEKLPFMKPVPGTKKFGDCCSKGFLDKRFHVLHVLDKP